MARDVSQRVADVRRIVEAARRVVAARGAHVPAASCGAREGLVPALVASTGLTAAGVELALTRHLELDPSDADLRALVAHAGDASRVTVILSANVFVGALRAIAIARAASEDVVVRPSRRDPAFARALVEAAAAPALRLDESLDAADVREGELHVYGHDRTIAHVRARVPAGVRVVAHGSGLGVAWIAARADLEAAARALAEDVVPFDQRGCLSPRIALVEGPTDRAGAFAAALHGELESLEATIPRGPLPQEERAESERYLATMAYAGSVLVGRAHAIGVAPPGAPLVSVPTYRHVHVASCATEADAIAILEPVRSALVSVGSDDQAAARRIVPAFARVSPLGSMQRPPLDGPVDRRGHRVSVSVNELN